MLLGGKSTIGMLLNKRVNIAIFLSLVIIPSKCEVMIMFTMQRPEVLQEDAASLQVGKMMVEAGRPVIASMVKRSWIGHGCWWQLGGGKRLLSLLVVVTKIK